jgi:PEP-CTERM motif-containing protein
MLAKTHLKTVSQLKRRAAAVGGSVVALVLAAAASHAGSVVQLPAVQSQSYEYFGLNYANNVIQNFASPPATLDYNGDPGCNAAGTCSATTHLGASPSASATVNEVVFQGGQGGYVEAELSYFVEDVGAPGSASVTLHASDSFAGGYALLDNGLPAVQDAQAYLAVGIGTLNADGESPTFSSYLVNETDCITRCSTGVANYLSPTPFPATQTIMMQTNTPYLVNEWVVIHPWSTAGQLSAFVDSSFSGGPGMPGNVPEPSTWAMMLAGLAGLALLGWWKSKPVPLTA